MLRELEMSCVHGGSPKYRGEWRIRIFPAPNGDERYMRTPLVYHSGMWRGDSRSEKQIVKGLVIEHSLEEGEYVASVDFADGSGHLIHTVVEQQTVTEVKFP